VGVCSLRVLVSVAVISEFEASFGITLPQDYKVFMLECSGGRPEADWVYCDESDCRFVFGVYE
jgi:hypothetical protein